jgi:hypothetical protein
VELAASCRGGVSTRKVSKKVSVDVAGTFLTAFVPPRSFTKQQAVADA